MGKKLFLKCYFILIGVIFVLMNSVYAEIKEDPCFLDQKFELYPGYSSYDDFVSRYPLRDAKASISLKTIDECISFFDDSFVQEKLLKLEIEAGYVFYHHPEVWKKLSQVKNLKSFRNRSRDFAESAELLLKAISTLRLVELDLTDTKISKADTLISFLPKSQITKLVLHGSFLSPEGIQGLAQVLPETQIEELDLAYNLLTPDVAHDLFFALLQTRVKRLSLFYNSLRGALLGHVLPKTQLEYLNLAENFFNDEDVIALSQALPKSRLRYLDLSANPIGSKGIRALIKVIRNSRLERLRLCDSFAIGGHVISMTDQEEVELVSAAREKGMNLDIRCKVKKD